MSDPKSQPLTEKVEKYINIDGFAVRSKAGAYLSTVYGNVWLKDLDWTKAEQNKRVQVSGVLFQFMFFLG